MATHQLLPRTLSGVGFSFFATILPELDQIAVFNSINFSPGHSSSPEAVANMTVSKMVLAAFLCPADGSTAQTHRQNYSINQGYGFDSHGGFTNGVDDPPRYLGYAAFTDGLSGTAMSSESLFYHWPITARDSKRSVFRTPSSFRQADQYSDFVTQCRSLDIGTAGLAETSRGRSWLTPNWGGGFYNHNLAPNDHTCLNGSLDFASGAWTANSNHSNGVNVLFLDGHASFVIQTVNLATWRAISTRAGGEVVSEQF